MSHIVKVSQIKILYLDLLEEVVNELGYKMKEGGKIYYWGGQRDTDYTIEIPRCNWTIGVRQEAPDEYVLVGDFFGEQGQLIKEAAEKITVNYQKKVAEMKLQEMGYSVEVEELPDGRVQVIGVRYE